MNKDNNNGAIADAVNRLKVNLDDLEKLGTLLEDRLVPVTTLVTPAPASVLSQTKDIPLSPIAMAVNDFGYRTETIGRRLRDLLSRIQL